LAELNGIPRSLRGWYDLYELASSPLAQATASSWLNYVPIPRLRQVYAGGDNFGLIELDMSKADPELAFNVYNSANEAVWQTFLVKASELKNGASLYQGKMDEESRRRYKQFLGGRPYYGRN